MSDPSKKSGMGETNKGLTSGAMDLGTTMKSGGDHEHGSTLAKT